jgi:hypothetical protein
MMIPREKLAGVSYKEEVRQVREKLNRTGLLTDRAFGFLVHDRLMTDLVRWDEENGVGRVDVIAAMDAHRHEIVSPVHLSRSGNAIVARAFADAILGGK